jgi:hypothetical protein
MLILHLKFSALWDLIKSLHFVNSSEAETVHLMKDVSDFWASMKFHFHTMQGAPVLKVCVTADVSYH